MNILVTEPMRKSVSGVTGAPVSIFATPKPFAKTSRSPLTTATAAPGVLVSLSSSSATFSSWVKSTLCCLANAGEAEHRSNESNTKQRGIRDSLMLIDSITEQILLSKTCRLGVRAFRSLWHARAGIIGKLIEYRTKITLGFNQRRRAPSRKTVSCLKRCDPVCSVFSMQC